MDGNWIPIVAIIGGLSFAAYNLHLKLKARQLMHQERLAMIERGIAPPPINPAELEEGPRPKRSSRHVGVILISIGIGLFLLIFFEGGETLGEAASVGGLFVLLGLGFLVNAMLDRRGEASKLAAGQKEPQ